jgi:uncharacterized membrane protein YgcG
MRGAAVAAGDFSAAHFSAGERYEIDRAIRAAEQASRCEFSVYVGAADGPPREFAERLHGALVAPARSVLILVDPQARAIEVVTGTKVRRTLSDREVALAIVGMQSAFSAGDLVGGLRRGICQLADHARAQHTLHARA